MKTNNSKNFIHKLAALSAAETMFNDAFMHEEHVTMSTHHSVHHIEVTIYTPGRRLPRIMKKLKYTRREITLHKKEDWTNFTCFSYYFYY